MVDKSALRYFLDDEFHYRGRDWYPGEAWNVSSGGQIEYQEKLKMDTIKKTQKNWVLFLLKKGNKKICINLLITV